MPIVRWSDQALAHIDAIGDYVLQHDRIAGARLAKRLRQAGDGLNDFPRRGREVEPGLHQLSIVYPYLIRYKVTDDLVTIVSVVHGARDEG